MQKEEIPFELYVLVQKQAEKLTSFLCMLYTVNVSSRNCIELHRILVMLNGIFMSFVAKVWVSWLSEAFSQPLAFLMQ